jgi:hypothetical protein
MWFPTALSFLDGRGDECKTQVVLFLAQDAEWHMTSGYTLMAVVVHGSDIDRMCIRSLHAHLCHEFGALLPPDHFTDHVDGPVSSVTKDQCDWA